MRLLFIALLMALNFSANAEWVKYYENDSKVYYLDPSTAIKDGVFMKIWELQDLKKPNTRGNISIRMRQEIDCRQQLFRILYLSEHEQQMGLGTIQTEFNGPSQWHDIPPSTNSHRVLRIVCIK